MGQNEVTVGEVYRRLVDMDERYEARAHSVDAKLDRIELQVKTTNGRTTKLETLVDGLRGSVRALWARLNDTPPHTPRNLPAPESGESFGFGVKISPGMWKAIYTAGGALATLLFPKLAEFLAKLGGS